MKNCVFHQTRSAVAGRSAFASPPGPAYKPVVYRARDASNKHAGGMFAAKRGAIYDCDLDLHGVKSTAHVAGFDT